MIRQMNRRNIYKSIVILLINICFVSIGNSQLKIGDQAPDLVLKGINGGNIQLSDFKGKVVLIDFWASWCAPCRKANPKLENLYQKYKSNDFIVLGVSLDSKETSWKSAVKKDKLTYPQVIDTKNWNSKIVQAYGVDNLPASFLIDGKGKIIALDPTIAQLEESLNR